MKFFVALVQEMKQYHNYNTIIEKKTDLTFIKQNRRITYVFAYENQQNRYCNIFKEKFKKKIKANSKENLFEKSTTVGEN